MGANYGGTASFDLASPREDPAFPAEFLLLPPGPNYLDGLVPEVIGTGYHHLSISLNETARSGNDPAWAVCPYIGGTCSPPSQQQFKDLIAASDLVAVMADVGPNGTGETYNLDNVTLTEADSTEEVQEAQEEEPRSGGQEEVQEQEEEEEEGAGRERSPQRLTTGASTSPSRQRS